MNDVNPSRHIQAPAPLLSAPQSTDKEDSEAPITSHFPLWLLALPLGACLLPLLPDWGINLASDTAAPGLLSSSAPGLMPSGLFHHTLLETAGAITATILLALAATHYSVRRDTTVALIALALAVAGSADIAHALTISGRFDSSTNPDLMTLTATIARIAGASALFFAAAAALLCKPRYLRLDVQGLLVVWVLASLLICALTIAIASTAPSPQGSFIALSPAVIFFTSLPFIWSLYRRRRDFFIATVVIGTLLNIIAEAYLQLASGQWFDHYFNGAHGLKIAAFALPLTGLLLDWRIVFSRQTDPGLSGAHDESESRFRSITEQLPVGVLLVDTEGVIVSANRGARELFAYSEKRLVGKSVDKLVPDSIRHHHRALRDGYQQNPKHRRMAADVDFLKGVRSDGREVPLEIGLGPIMLNGRPHTLVSVLDISERKQLLDDLTRKNAILQESESRFRAITEQLPVGVLLVGTDGIIVSSNRSARELFGYREQELTGSNVDKLVPTTIRSRHQHLRNGYQRSPKPRRMAADVDFLKGVCSDGSEVPLEIGLGPIMLEGRPHTLVSVLDVSERKQLLDDLTEKNTLMDQTIDKLTQSNEQLERFAFVCSHDLQEPVRMVQSFSQLLEQRLGDRLQGKEQEYLHFITDGAQRARNMISDVLLFCRLDQPVDSRKSVSLPDVCQQVHNTLQASLKESHGRFTWDAEVPTLNAVPSQFFQLLLNLVSNGLKFNRSAAPTVVLLASVEGDHCRIEIRDNGIGINPRYQEKIFQIFERLNAKTEYPGTGIGLAICKKIAEQHDAELTLTSAEGKGSAFVLSWPLHRKTKRSDNATETFEYPVDRR